MNTAVKGDIAEQAIILKALKRGWAVSRPIGNRLPYDLILDLSGVLVKVQVKYAWFDNISKNFVIDNRRTKTNRRIMLRERYTESDFDFAIAYIEENDSCYIFPVSVFISYAGPIPLVEAEKRQRKPRSAKYRDFWELIEEWASQRETVASKSLKFGEVAGGDNSEPSPQFVERCRDLTGDTLISNDKGEGKVQTANS